MVGISMAIAMVLCISAFIWLYVQIGPLLSDFVSQDPAADEDDPGTTGLISTTDETTPTPTGSLLDEFELDEIEPEPLETPPESPSLDENEGDVDEVDLSDDEQEDEDAWEPTHQIRDGPNVNFRSGPNTISETQGALSPGTGLRFLDEEEPSGGVTWMFFDIEDGTEGWIRDIDVIEYEGDGQNDDEDEDPEEDDE